MKLYVLTKTYNIYGGHPTLSLIGDFLLREAPDFGTAVGEITVTLYFDHSGQPKPTLEHLFEQHRSYRAELPKITFRRAKKSIDIRVSSSLIDGADWKSARRISVDLFRSGLTEVVECLALVRKRIKRTDDFRVVDFLSFCESVRLQVPATEDQLNALANELEVARKAELDALSPWDRLGIDWNDYHPSAKAILDSPLYWDPVNDFAPNGNDTGADVLADYRVWLKSHDSGRPIEFLEQLAKRWGYSGTAAMPSDVHDLATIGVAFADIKLRGTCDAEANRAAQRAIANRRDQAESARGWSHRDDCLKALDVLDRKLRGLTSVQKTPPAG